MLPRALPDLTMAVEVPGDVENSIDIDNGATTSVQSSDVDVVDAFDLPYNMRVTSSSSASGGGVLVRGTERRSLDSERSTDAILSNAVNDSTGSENHVEVNSSGDAETTADDDDFDRKLIEIGTNYARKIGYQCMKYVSDYCWDLLSYDNIPDEFLLNVSGGCGLSAVAIMTARDSLSERLGPRGNHLLRCVNNSVLPILTSSTVASGFLYIFKKLASSDHTNLSVFGHLMRRGSRELSRARLLPQLVTIFSFLIAVFAYRMKLEFGNMQWLVKIWTSRILKGIFRRQQP